MRLLAVVALISLSARADVFLFGGPGIGWHLVDAAGLVTRKLVLIGGKEATDATVTRDGKRWAAAVSDGRPHLLTYADLDGPPIRDVELPGDVLDGLAFSDDGEWVYFSANDEKQPRFDGQSMRYAQLYRAHFSQGVVERLTMERGCHMWPRPTRTGLLNSHATCYGGRSLELRARNGKVTTLVPISETVGESAVATDGRVFYFLPTTTGTQLVVRGGAGTTVWGETRINSMRTRPQWVDAETIFFQNNHRLWRLRRGELFELAVLWGKP